MNSKVILAAAAALSLGAFAQEKSSGAKITRIDVGHAIMSPISTQKGPQVFTSKGWNFYLKNDQKDYRIQVGHELFLNTTSLPSGVEKKVLCTHSSPNKKSQCFDVELVESP